MKMANSAGIVTVNVDDQLKEIPGTEKTWEADLIMLSMGFLQPEHYINEALGDGYRRARQLQGDQRRFQNFHTKSLRRSGLQKRAGSCRQSH